MKILGIIPARGGSKGIPRKNIRMLAGKPLLAYTAESALASHRLSCVILSTDDPEIANVGRDLGLEVPFLRPRELALDETPTLPVLQHAVRWLEDDIQSHVDAVCLLQPTNPLRPAGWIDECIALFERTGADSVVTMVPTPVHYHPQWAYFADEEGVCRLCMGGQTPIPRRQDLAASFHREGSVYVTRRDVLMDQGSLYGKRLVGYVVSPDRSVNLDSEADWVRAEAMLAGLRP